MFDILASKVFLLSRLNPWYPYTALIIARLLIGKMASNNNEYSDRRFLLTGFNEFIHLGAVSIRSLT